MIDEFINKMEVYVAIGIDFIIAHLMTIEGIVTLVFGLFFLGLISQLRS
ncbi:hypothetical protein [Fodinibius sp. Rm-B-1B1-1]